MHRRWCAVTEIRECGAPADLFDLAAALKLLGDGEDVNRLAQLVEREDGRIDLAVRRLVEVRRLERFGDLGNRVAVDQDGAEYGLFGLRGLWWELACHGRILSAAPLTL